VGKVGRFQVMAVLQAARARTLGLDLDEAKSWGLNRAVFYAAAKRGFRHGGAGGVKPPRAEAPPADRAAEQPVGAEYVLGGEKAYLAADRSDGLRFAIGDEVQTPRDFDWQVQRRFNDWDSAWAEALAMVEAADPADLKSQRRFYEHVYKPLRDKLAARWSALRQSAAQAS
jgi:hypothetical protein